MARADLTNTEVERMGREKPGSAAEYLRLRREELEAEKQAERARDDYARFERAFVGEGGGEGGIHALPQRGGRESRRGGG